MLVVVVRAGVVEIQRSQEKPLALHTTAYKIEQFFLELRRPVAPQPLHAWVQTPYPHCRTAQGEHTEHGICDRACRGDRVTVLSK